MNTAEAADHLGIRRNTIQRHIRDGKIVVTRPGGRDIDISEAALAQFIAARAEQRGNGKSGRPPRKVSGSG